MVKLYTGKIPTKGTSFQDFVNKVTGGNVKTASVKTAEEAEEAETSGQPQAEAKLVNVPKKEEGKAQSSGADNSEAETSGQPQAEAKLVNKPEVKKEAKVKDKCKKCECEPCECKKKAEAEGKTKEAAGGDFGGKKAPPFGKKDDKDETNKDEDGDEKKKEAASKPGFVRLAKLNPQTKSWLKDYWRNIYPSDYVDAMLADN